MSLTSFSFSLAFVRREMPHSGTVLLRTVGHQVFSWQLSSAEPC